MPFDEEEDKPSLQSQKIGLRNVSSQKSIFDSAPKKPSPQEFENKVREVHNRSLSYKERAAELALQFKKIMDDKTLSQNKNVFALELEKEILTKMIKLADEINNDPNELEGIGSLGWITLLFKTCLSQRDRMNNLEYQFSILLEKIKNMSGIDAKKSNE